MSSHPPRPLLPRPWFALYFIGMAALFAALVLAGIWQRYDRVPMWDMWDAYLGFYDRAQSSLSAWWEQHNEHRLVLSRLIFWADLRFFSGAMVMLYALNVVLALLIAACLGFLLRQLLPQPLPGTPADTTALCALLVLLCMSWMQSENFLWAFQSQFFMAYLMPLTAFTLLAHAHARAWRTGYWLALLAGVCSAGTMANGIAALPLLTLQALLMRLSRRDVFTLLLTSAVTLALFFTGWQTPKHYGAPESNLLARWPEVLQYLLLYLGGPWYFVLQHAAWWPAQVAGLIWLALALTLTVRVLRQRPASPYAVALLILLAYLGLAALGAVRGRIILGVEQALASRYLTPQTIGWIALLLLSLQQWPALRHSRALWALLLSLPLLLLPQQWKAPHTEDYLVNGRVLPSLAVTLDIADLSSIGQINYEGRRTLDLAAPARRDGLALFGQADIRLAQAYWAGQGAPLTVPAQVCQGVVEHAEPVPEQPDIQRMYGWLFDSTSQRTPSLIVLQDAHGVTQGVALSGYRRQDVVNALAQPRAEFAGFGGYLRAPLPTDDAPLTLVALHAQQPVCHLRWSTQAAP